MDEAEPRSWLARTAVGAVAAGVVGFLAYDFFEQAFGPGTRTTAFTIGVALAAVAVVEYLWKRR